MAAPPPTVIRVKRARPGASLAPALLTVECGAPAKKKARLALADMSLGDGDGSNVEPPPRRALRFRKVQVGGVRKVIEKARVFEVPLVALGGKGKGGRGEGTEQGDCGKGEGEEKAKAAEDKGGNVAASPGSCSGPVEEVAKVTEMAAKYLENYDYYLQESEGNGEAVAVDDADTMLVDASVPGFEEMLRVLAGEAEFMNESSEDEPGDADLEDSEGSIDYPSTPEGSEEGGFGIGYENVAQDSSESEDEDDPYLADMRRRMKAAENSDRFFRRRFGIDTGTESEESGQGREEDHADDSIGDGDDNSDAGDY